jgi:hypothetical protein
LACRAIAQRRLVVQIPFCAFCPFGGNDVLYPRIKVWLTRGFTPCLSGIDAPGRPKTRPKSAKNPAKPPKPGTVQLFAKIV